MNRISSSILATMLLALAVTCQSINLVNTPNTTTTNTRKLQELRDKWCRYTMAPDRNYDAKAQYFFRAVRGNILGSKAADVIEYFNGGTTTAFIQNIRWPFGVLLTLLVIVFITWVIFLVFLCSMRKQVRNEANLTGCLRWARLLLVLFIALFVVILVFIGLAEVYQRRSKCQVLNVGNMLVNGYVSQVNGNQYVGLTAMHQAVLNFRNEYQNVTTVGQQGVRIVNSNFPDTSAEAIRRLQAVAASSSMMTTTSPLGFVDTPDSIAAINGWFSPSAQVEYSNLHALTMTLDAAGRSLSNVQNGIVNGVNVNLDTSVNNLSAFFSNITADTTTVALESFYQLRNRYGYATGAYWTIFAISLVLIVLCVYLVYKVTLIQDNANEKRNFGLLKGLVALLGFFLLWYAILTMILLAGSGTIASFCTILSNLNQGNWRYIDDLDLKWPGNSQHVLKECTVGKTGDLWNFQSLWPELSQANNANDIKNILLGVTNYMGLYANPKIAGSSAVAYHVSHYQAIRQGIAHDYNTLSDQVDTLHASWTNSSLNTANGIPSLTNYNCSSVLSSERSRCQAMDQQTPVNFGTDSTFSNFTIAQNLRNYILSEQLTLQSVMNNLQNRNDVLTPGQAYRDIKRSLDQRLNDVNDIRTAFPTTFGIFNHYKGQAIYTFDCRNIRRELTNLEDHYCFELNVWVNVLTVVSAISLCVLFMLSWAICAAVREADTEGEIADMPIPASDYRASINERELIPQA